MRVKLHMEVLVSRGSSADSAEEGQMVPWDLKCTNCLYTPNLYKWNYLESLEVD